MTQSAVEKFLPVADYDLAATLTSGQSFRWDFRESWWEGVVDDRWVRLQSCPGGMAVETVVPQTGWSWLTHYLQTDVDLGAVLLSLPVYAFPSAERLAAAGEAELRACKMGFRAPNLLATARLVAAGEIDLERLRGCGVEEARSQLTQLPGVGLKIADCVLLFAYGFQQAFPVDVWVMKALRQLYFPKRRPSPARLRQFVQTHFGAHSGYAQQYLFHYMRRHRAAVALNFAVTVQESSTPALTPALSPGERED